jgi:hypothetical protein
MMIKIMMMVMMLGLVGCQTTSQSMKQQISVSVESFAINTFSSGDSFQLIPPDATPKDIHYGLIIIKQLEAQGWQYDPNDPKWIIQYKYASNTEHVGYGIYSGYLQYGRIGIFGALVESDEDMRTEWTTDIAWSTYRDESFIELLPLIMQCASVHVGQSTGRKVEYQFTPNQSSATQQPVKRNRRPIGVNR